MRILNRISSQKNNSVPLLALLCLVYFLVTSNPLYSVQDSEPLINESGKTLIEISEDGISTIRTFYDQDDLAGLKTEHGLSRDLRSGDKIVIGDVNTELSSISGRKKISLGIPIGINSAAIDDLTAIPGIGEELASRIVGYRDSKGYIYSLDDLDSIEGIGDKKLLEIKKVANVD